MSYPARAEGWVNMIIKSFKRLLYYINNIFNLSVILAIIPDLRQSLSFWFPMHSYNEIIYYAFIVYKWYPWSIIHACINSWPLIILWYILILSVIHMILLLKKSSSTLTALLLLPRILCRCLKKKTIEKVEIKETKTKRSNANKKSICWCNTIF